MRKNKIKNRKVRKHMIKKKKGECGKDITGALVVRCKNENRRRVVDFCREK